MSTGIEWTDETWNPVTGCTKVSPGCDHCYAETIAHRFAGGVAFPNSFKPTLLPGRLEQPLHWRKPRRVFVNSMSDLFHADVPDEYIAKVFAVMAATPQHTYQILTKRHGRMRNLLNELGFREELACQAVILAEKQGRTDLLDAATPPWPLPNLWLGVSVETQQWADIRVPALLDTPAAVRFLSCEPLLGPVDLASTGASPFWCLGHGRPSTTCPNDLHVQRDGGISWVIVGGESGPHARPMHPAWPRHLRDQCVAAGVPFFLKQWGEWGPADWKPQRLNYETDEQYKARADAVGATHAHTHNQLADGSYHIYQPSHRPWSIERSKLPAESIHAGIRRWGKKAAGRELDGRTWDQYPQAVTA